MEAGQDGFSGGPTCRFCAAPLELTVTDLGMSPLCQTVCADRVPALLRRECEEGLRSPDRYQRFAKDVIESKRALLDLLLSLQREGKRVAGYGAPAKGNTLLNYCGIRADLVEYTVDRNPYKHGTHTPGTHIPIRPVEHIAEARPD